MYDDGEYAVSRDMAGSLHRLIFAELPLTGLVRKINFIDSSHSDGFRNHPGKLVGPYSPYCGVTGLADRAAAVYEHWFSIKENEITEDDLIEGAKPIPPIEIPHNGQLIQLRQPSYIVWRSVRNWCTQTVYVESEEYFAQRVADSDSPTRIKRIEFSRENFITVFRNEVGAHFDRNISEDFLNYESAAPLLHATRDGQKLDFINKPSDCIMRALSAEVCVSLRHVI